MLRPVYGSQYSCNPAAMTVQSGTRCRRANRLFVVSGRSSPSHTSHAEVHPSRPASISQNPEQRLVAHAAPWVRGGH